MKTLRVSVAGLMALVFLVAVSITALKRASPLWSSAFFTADLGLLSTATLTAAARKGRVRIIWGGAALFGWVYLVSAFGLGPSRSSPVVISRPIMEAVFPHIYPPDVFAKSVRLGDFSWVSGPAFPRSMTVIYADSYFQIGHSLGVVAFAFVGALVGRLLVTRSDEVS